MLNTSLKQFIRPNSIGRRLIHRLNTSLSVSSSPITVSTAPYSSFGQSSNFSSISSSNEEQTATKSTNKDNTNQNSSPISFETPSKPLSPSEHPPTIPKQPKEQQTKLQNLINKNKPPSPPPTKKQMHIDNKQQARTRAPSLYQKQQTTNLREMIREHDLVGAWRLFNDKLESGSVSVDVKKFTTMCMVCDSSDHMWEFITVDMKNAGVKPDVYTFNVYLTSLMVEGQYEKAKATIENFMTPMGILSNDKIEQTLNLPQDSLDRLRTSKFKHLYEQGQREAAVKLFQILQEQGIQETFYYNTMIKHCHHR